MILAGLPLPERPQGRDAHWTFNAAARRCAHPHCRTTLGEYPVECPHGLPFCDNCTWEEACAECAA